jgi:hypothetical protein
MADHPVNRLEKDNLLCSETLLKSQISIFDKFEAVLEKSLNQSFTDQGQTDMRVQKFPKSEEK